MFAAPADQQHRVRGEGNVGHQIANHPRAVVLEDGIVVVDVHHHRAEVLHRRLQRSVRASTGQPPVVGDLVAPVAAQVRQLTLAVLKCVRILFVLEKK